jgi:flagellar basal body-associated protein FliL
MAEKKEQKKKKKRRGFNFLSLGKYFLLFLIIAVQVLLAYAIVDRNYEKVYRTVESIMREDTGVYKFEELIVNPTGTNGQRFLVVEISIELERESHVELVETHEQQIKHEMNEALTARTIDQLSDFQEREFLRRELANIVNDVIEKRSVRNLYYTRYVMQ